MNGKVRVGGTERADHGCTDDYLSCHCTLLCFEALVSLLCRVENADVAAITALFFLLVLMAATQDIAVDGWALTLLARNNVG